MRKVVGWPVTWALFWLGHATSKVFLRQEAADFMYPLYNGLMCASVDVQDWAGLAMPWAKP